MRRLPSLLAWALGAAVAAPVVAAAQADRPVVAVLYFDNNSFGKDRADYDNLGKGIADLLINDMAQNPAMRVVERDRIQSILQEHNLIKAGSVDPQTAVQLGKILGAQYMITGGFMSDGRGHLVLTSRVIDVQTSRIMDPVKLQSNGDDVLGLIAQLSTKLNGDLKLPPLERRTGDAGANAPAVGTREAARQAGKQVAESKPAPKLDVRTALLYSKALEAQDSGDRTKAAELYRAVLAKFPDFGPARSNLQKVEKSAD